MNKYGLKLTDDEIERLWETYRRTRSDADRNVIADAYFPLLRREAACLVSRLPRCVELGDLVSWGAFGLLRAIETFDPGRPASFTTHSIRRVRGAMLDGLRAVAPTTRLTRERSHRIELARDELYATTGVRPTDSEVAERAGLTVLQVRETAAALAVAEPASLDPTGGREESHLPLAVRSAQSREADPYETTAQREAYEVAVQPAGPMERAVIAGHVIDGETYHAIARKLKCSDSWICMLAKQGRQRIRGATTYEAMRELLSVEG